MHSGCLFCGGDPREPGHALRCDGRQGFIEAELPLAEDVNAERDAAIAQVADHAEATHPNFQEDAKAFVIRYLQTSGPTAGELLTLKCKAVGIVPHDDRAFGAVYMSLAKQRVIERVGVVRRERGHGTAGGNIWALVRRRAS